MEDKNELSWLDVFVYGLMPLGQIFARSYKLNGSLDKWWMLFPLFLIPPFGIFGLIALKLLKPEAGKGVPSDSSVALPILVKVAAYYYLTTSYTGDRKPSGIIKFLIGLFLFISIFITNINRRSLVCDKVTLTSTGKAISDSTVTLAVAQFLPWVMQFMPYLNKAASGSNFDLLYWIVGYVSAALLINMSNQNTPDHPEKFCSTPLSGRFEDRFMFVISVVVILGLGLFAEKRGTATEIQSNF